MTTERPDPAKVKRGLQRLRDMLDEIDQRKYRASKRLEREGGEFIYLAIIGLKISIDEFEFVPEARLQRVEEHPGEMELARALRNSQIVSAIGRYAHGIQHELRVGRDALKHAWPVISALRVRTCSEFLVPAFCDRSWSTIAAFEDRSCVAGLYEDIPQARPLSEQAVEIREEDLEWVKAHLTAFVELYHNESFSLAAEALATHHHYVEDERIMTAMLWSGIEALFGVESELRFRLATSVAVALEPRGTERRNLYEAMKRHYDVRSKAVHGGRVSQKILHQHVLDVRSLLSRLLCRFVEIGKVPSQHDIEKMVFE